MTWGSWNDFEKLFGARGSPNYCWCMAWRTQRTDPESGSGAGRRKLMRQRVKQGVRVGLLGYLDGDAVAWCSLAPFDTFRGLRKPGEAEETEKLWSITCFFVRREHRGTGLAKQLLAAAVRHARKHGARLVEGHAVAPDSPSYRHMGFRSMFEEAGFTEVARAGTRRHVMQLAVRPSARS